MGAASPVELISVLRSALDLIEQSKIINKDSPVVRDFKRATSKLIAEILLAGGHPVLKRTSACPNAKMSIDW